MIKNSPARATGALISILGHITLCEPKRLLTDTETGNGFANRFLWVCSKRSKCLPDGGAFEQVDFESLTQRLKSAVNFARTVDKMERDPTAGAIWRKVYSELSDGKPGLFGAVTSRGEAQVLRLSGLYALLDSSAVVLAEHLMAALAVWEYCLNSAPFIFGSSLGDATAEKSYARCSHPEGMARTDIRQYFSKNKLSAEIERALSALQEYGRARMEKEEKERGRPVERWFAISATP